MYYRLYFIGQNNRILGVEPFEAETDEQAIAWALKTSKGRTVELWNQSRMVGRFS